ncbi:MAG: hypothetical protein QHJ34_05825 [bacterium]|jgi:Tol biopolymer transport system component|nr:hypothetical protein [candidate division KSB1 bacterium]MDH7559738.1 hypothetical protein [bacterium]
MRLWCFIFIAAPVLTLSCARPDREFYKTGQPHLLAEGIISTPRCETRCCLTPDGRTLFFATMGWDPQDSLNQDIYFSRWQKGQWTPPQPVPFNSQWQEFDPAVTPDGRWLYFCSDRPGGRGGADIWRVPLQENGCGEPENLGSVVNSRGDDWGPSFSSDGRVMVFSSDGRGGAGGHDLFRSAWSGKEWASPANLGRQINSAQNDFDPCVVGAMEKIIFASDRPGGHGGLDLWETRYENGTWSVGEVLPAPLNSQAWDSCPYLSPSGKSFYFSSTRRSGLPAAADIYVVVAK